MHAIATLKCHPWFLLRITPRTRFYSAVGADRFPTAVRCLCRRFAPLHSYRVLIWIASSTLMDMIVDVVQKNPPKISTGCVFLGTTFFCNPALAGDCLFKSMWVPKTITMTSQVWSRVSYLFLHMWNALEWCFDVVLPCQLTDSCDHIFYLTETVWPLGKRSLTAENAFPSGFFVTAELKHMFSQYFGLARYCFVIFWICCLALTSWAWFWSPFTHTRLTIRACIIDWVFYMLRYSLVPSLLCYVVWGWAELIADHLKLLTREAIIG